MSKKSVKKFVKDHKYELIGFGIVTGVFFGKNMVKSTLRLSPELRKNVQFYIAKKARDILPLPRGEEVCILVRECLSESQSADNIIKELPGKILYVSKGRA